MQPITYLGVVPPIKLVYTSETRHLNPFPESVSSDPLLAFAKFEIKGNEKISTT